jgi:hypothetical protein
MDSNNKVILDLFQNLLRKHLQAEARMDALQGMILFLGKKAGITHTDGKKMIESLKAAALQARLELVENQSPSLAAAMDRRPVPGEGPPRRRKP